MKIAAVTLVGMSNTIEKRRLQAVSVPISATYATALTSLSFETRLHLQVRRRHRIWAVRTPSAGESNVNYRVDHPWAHCRLRSQ